MQCNRLEAENSTETTERSTEFGTGGSIAERSVFTVEEESGIKEFHVGNVAGGHIKGKYSLASRIQYSKQRQVVSTSSYLSSYHCHGLLVR
ncbi:hypothetical protein JTB14_003126 [Gonioctena quinquepunctata]|nr:hypothetical protein JTB14_003126 [Gonioctena quinquepunctata]